MDCVFKLHGGFDFFRIASLSLRAFSMDYSFNGRLNIDSRLFGLRVTWLTRFTVHNPVYLGGIDIPVDTNLLTEARLSAAVCKRSIYLKTLIAMANITS